MEDQVPFKVFTHWGVGDHMEVRRFGVEKTLVTSFVYLNAKLQEIFPGLKEKKYYVTWRDEEGDDVTISSDDELMTAITSLGGSLIKLHVHMKKLDIQVEDGGHYIFSATIPENIAEAADTVTMPHFGVVCDGCNNAIVGFRYKCTTCDNFDLCAKCESAGMHPEHCMVRVPSPTLPRTVIKAAIKRSRQFLKTVAHSMPEECAFKRHRRERSGERKHRGEHGPHGSHDDHPRPDRHHRRPRSSWLETFATYMNEFANLAGDIDLDAGNNPANAKQQPKKQQQQQNKTQEQQQAAAENTSAHDQPEPTTSTTDTGIPPKPMSSNIGNIVRLIELCAMKSTMATQPGAVSNDASVNTNDVTTNNASVNTNDVATNNASVNTNDVEMTQDDQKASNADKISIHSMASSSSAASKRDESPDKGDDWTVINNEKDLMDAYVKLTSQDEASAAPIGFNLPEKFREQVNITEGQNLYPPLHAASAVLNPKELIRRYEEPQPSAPQSTTPQAHRPHVQPQPQPLSPQPLPQQPQPQPQPQPQQARSSPPQEPTYPQPRHPKAHIQAAIENMLAMGFTNDGGWLTQLLESKNGNIAAVLDLLTPVNPKRQ